MEEKTSGWAQPTALLVFALGAFAGWTGASMVERTAFAPTGAAEDLATPPFDERCLASLNRQTAQANRCINGWTQTKDLLTTCVNALERERGKEKYQ